jgi:hypothetical protein
MQSQSRISKRQAKKLDTKDRRRQTKERFEGTQRQIWHGLLFQVPGEPRIHLAKPKFGPKSGPRLKMAARQAVEDRPLITIAHNSTITYAGIPNPNYAAHSDILRYAAIRIPNCVSGTRHRCCWISWRSSKTYIPQPGFSCLHTNNHRPRYLSKQHQPMVTPVSMRGLDCGASTPAVLPPSSINYFHNA